MKPVTLHYRQPIPPSQPETKKTFGNLAFHSSQSGGGRYSDQPGSGPGVPVVTLIARFKDSERGRNCPRHLTQKIRVLEDFVSSAGVYMASDITPEAIDHYLACQEDKGMSRQTLRHKFDMIARFAGWLISRNQLSTDPAKRMERPKVVRKAIIYLTDAEFAKALEIAEQTCPPALAALLTGGRMSEIRNLRWSSLQETSRGPVLVFGTHEATKTGLVRSVPVHPRLGALLARLGPGDPEDRIFGGLSERTWGRMLVDMKRQIPKMARAGGGWRDLRRTFASLLVARGERIGVVSKLLGHSSITMTEKYYAHLSPEFGREAVNRL